MKYYLGGYYLMQIQPIEFGSEKNQRVLTCSTCINNSLFDSWSFSWATTFKRDLKKVKQDYLIDEEAINSIRLWVDSNFDGEPKNVGWPNVFSTIQAAKTYHKVYFSHLRDIKLFALYFNESEATALIEEFKPTFENQGLIGLVDTLQNRIVEDQSINQQIVGYDLIGVEIGGDFHTFHCHTNEVDLITMFKLEMNEYGLFEENENLSNALNYMNDEDNGFEPVPWFLVKVKALCELA
ncbi:hypothetical protein [Hymenobacter lapidiphilus]|uniref:Uncharacterized protein n=1 Tax=Hymenobacter lapidiphilus TaxID=2608003 RepID=A0A7Y7U3V1_9BACT|nr:hypothetical protein [Hymenobacter lapidiphilus]NVO29758.1 hypothetical protein [Hymenobacter lapidiphilus]